ncbi:response regulator [Microcoleus sp. FACHB-1515]|uniref:response regulator n=1 Tax=Cyanophyceae TaxID=3028117 RepID=UPI001689B67E|nr:response regulator [Microcoleus sp. FACHB-1515]MBD2093010.1 response regulator [Microcoleus sp. FACHB-1515]
MDSDTSPQPLKVLVAEDDVFNQKLMVQMLDRLGFSADCVSDGREALQALRHQAYRAVLMDVQMLKMDGISAARQIRQDSLMCQQPYIIALTGRALPEEQAECLQAGMNDCLTKPIRLETLSEALSHCKPIAS